MVPQHTAIWDQILSGLGGSVEVLMARGLNFGDGQQASHWKDNLDLGILDPTMAPGQLLGIGPNDLRAMDLLGYEITVPEPAGAALFLLGGLVAAGRPARSRRLLAHRGRRTPRSSPPICMPATTRRRC